MLTKYVIWVEICMNIRIMICINEIWLSKSGYERHGCLRRDGETKYVFINRYWWDLLPKMNFTWITIFQVRYDSVAFPEVLSSFTRYPEENKYWWDENGSYVRKSPVISEYSGILRFITHFIMSKALRSSAANKLSSRLYPSV